MHFLLSAYYVIVVPVAAREPAGVGHVYMFINMTQISTSDACASGRLADLSVVQRLTPIGLTSSVFLYAATLTQQAACLWQPQYLFTVAAEARQFADRVPRAFYRCLGAM